MHPGVLHAPGSLCTYEPQKASDIFAVYQSLASDTIMPEEFLWKNTPENKMKDVEHLLDVIDWDLNFELDFVAHRFMRPVPVRPEREIREEGFVENRIYYRSTDFSADGIIVMQGHGNMGE